MKHPISTCDKNLLTLFSLSPSLSLKKEKKRNKDSFFFCHHIFSLHVIYTSMILDVCNLTYIYIYV